MRCEFGFCIVCDKEIAPISCACGKRKPNNDYTEVLMPWTNGSRMAMAVCTECAPEKIWKADKTEMTKALWQAWDKQGATYDPTIVICD